MAPRTVSRKKLLKQEDEFLSLSARGLAYVRKHAKMFRYAGSGVGLLLILYMIVYAYLGYVERKGQAAYNEAYYALDRNPGLTQDPAKLKSVEESFKKVIDDYGLSEARRLAYPELAHIKFTEKKYDEAIPLYMEYLKTTPAGLYHSLAMLALAGCYEGKGEPEKAVDMLKRIMGGSDDASKEVAAFNLARVYRLAGQTDKSVEALKEFAAKYKDSPFLPLVKAQLDKDLS